MKIRIYQKTGKESDKALFREAAEWMLRQLLRPEQVRHVTLHIHLTTLSHDYGDIELHAAPTFKVRIHQEDNTIMALLTLAHELVHLSQVVEGRLKLVRKGFDVHWYWDGRPYGPVPYSLDLHLPWELDAERRETALTRHFLSEYVTKLNAS